MSDYTSDMIDAAADRHDAEQQVLKEAREAEEARMRQATADYLEAGRRYGGRSLHTPDGYKGAHFSHQPYRSPRGVYHEQRAASQGSHGRGTDGGTGDGKGGPSAGGRGWMQMFLKGWKDLFWDK